MKGNRVTTIISRSFSLRRSQSLCKIRIFCWRLEIREPPLVYNSQVSVPRLRVMEHDETGCQAAPEGPILCVNNCGFFGSATTMNMCSKCHKEFVMNQECCKIAASSIDDIVNGTVSSKDKEPVVVESHDLNIDLRKEVTPIQADTLAIAGSSGEKLKGANRCGTCNKRVGLTGFKCRCSDLFCSMHRYSDKHNCSFDYKSAGKEAIQKANPVVKAPKLERKI